jgi:phosphoglucosamine mutase
MSNLGLEQALAALGIPFLRAAVGDRHVMAMLKAEGGQLGGETSGHIINLAKTSTGDGLATALQVLAVMKHTGQSLGELVSAMQRLPQVMINVRMTRRIDLAASAGVQDALAGAEAGLGRRGRIVLRPSGTEPVVRVMVEAADATEAQAVAGRLADAVRAAAGH